MVRLGLLAMFLAGCGRSPQACSEEGAALGKLLEEAAREPPSPVHIPDDVTPALRADLPPTQMLYAPAVDVLKTGPRYQGQAVTVAELRERLADAYAKIKEDLEYGKTKPKWVPEPRLVHFLIDAGAPWPLVVDAVGAAVAAEMTAISLVYVAPQTLKLPPRSAIDDELDKLVRSDDGNKATEFARITREQIKGCPALNKVFGAVGGEEGGNKALMIAQGVPEALVECSCRVNMPQVRSVLFRIMYVEKPVRAVQLDPTQPAETVELPASTTWADATKLIKPGAKNLRFVVR